MAWVCVILSIQRLRLVIMNFDGTVHIFVINEMNFARTTAMLRKSDILVHCLLSSLKNRKIIANLVSRLLHIMNCVYSRPLFEIPLLRSFHNDPAKTTKHISILNVMQPQL